MSDQVEIQINEYFPTSELAQHKDSVVSYRDAIFGVRFDFSSLIRSLGSDCELLYTLFEESKRPLIPARSLYIMSGDSRYKWQHGPPTFLSLVFLSLVLLSLLYP